ncbi:MAG: DUF4091 domain-containing protein [Anaerolineales bacterium]|nr:DUF4091 domain-containing protein [Anaerolineales bacterium]
MSSILVLVPLVLGGGGSSPALAEGFGESFKIFPLNASPRIAVGTGIARVWAVDDGEKVKQGDLNHPQASGENNVVWDGERIRIYGARNEVVAFQLILQAGSSGSEGVNIQISDLRKGAYAIPGSESGPLDPYDYRGRYVELFTEHYLQIDEPSRGGTAWSRWAAPSAYYLGWVPDALIPFAAPPGMGGAPFDIRPNLNQGVWVDIWIPRDAPKGVLTADVIISESGEVTYKVPLELEVYDFSLPDETHFQSMFAIEPGDIGRRHSVEFDTNEYYEIETRYHQMAHRHRFDIVESVRNLSQMRRYHNKYLSGLLYTAKYGYAGPGEGIGNQIFSIGFYGAVPTEYGGSFHSWSEESWWNGSDAWASWFQENAPHVDIHKFLLPDEPETESELNMIQTQAIWSHTNPGIGSVIPTFVTHWIDPDYQGYVDIWSISADFSLNGTKPGTSIQDLQAELSEGRKVGIYNGYRPATGSTLIDTDAIDFRVIPWIGWKYDLDHYFYWMTTYWTDHLSNKRWNVFTNPKTTKYMRNGGGTFFYPGEDYAYVEENRELPGPMSSIRMKNWRRGMQDYEYLWVANKLGLMHEVEEIVNRAVPAALWEANPRGDISWSTQGVTFERFRRELAELIVSTHRPQVVETQEVVGPVFQDVGEDHPYANEINELYRLGYLSGCGQDPLQFCPDRPWTRAEAAVLFGRLIYSFDTKLDSAETQVFTDVPLNGGYSWVEPYASMLWKDGYMSRCSKDPNNFCPNAPMTRVDAVVVLLKLLFGPEHVPPDPLSIFSDVSDRWWEAGWIEEVYEMGILSPCRTSPSVRFCPFSPISRGQAAHLLFRALALAMP